MPNITRVIVVTEETIIDWMTDEEGGARPVECYYGNITEVGGEGKIIPFDFCSSSNPRELRYQFEGINNSNFSVEVCARNRQGQNCSLPAAIIPPTDSTTNPSTTDSTTNPSIIDPTPNPSTNPPTDSTTHPSSPATTTNTPLPPPSTAENDIGLIVGVAVGVLILLCGLTLLILTFCLCGKRRYFQERKGKST